MRKVYGAVLEEAALPGVIGSIQTFGELIHSHPHIHMIATDGAFRPDRTFLPMPKTSAEPFLKIWEHEIFRLLLKEKLITEEVVAQMRTTPDGGVVYKTDHSEWKKFPHWKAIPTLPGMIRNFEVFKPLDFLAQGARRDDRSVDLARQHIPDRSQHLIRYYGWYSNKARGVRRKVAAANAPVAQASAVVEPDKEEDTEIRKAARRRWAQLIKKVYEVDPLVCPKCSGPMEIVAFVTDAKAIGKILRHIGQNASAERAPPKPSSIRAPAAPAEWTYVPSEHIP